MKNRSRLFALLLTLAVGLGYAFAQSSAVKAVYVKSNNLFTIGADGKPQQLTFDGIPKGNPLWSKDGTKIAFERKIDRGVALDNLIVIDPETGQTLATLLICPTSPGEEYDVRYIEGFEWLTEDKIVAKGSIDPSSTHTFVYDINTGKELTDYVDHDGGAVFSPDGEHAATRNGSPHFTPEPDRAPELDIDNQRVYPANGIHPVFLSKPAWSQDSEKVAVVVEDDESKQPSVVVCGLKGGCPSTALPTPAKLSPDDRFIIQWKDGRVFASYPASFFTWAHGTVPETTWSLQPGDANAVVSAPRPSAYDSQLSYQNQVQKLGGDAAENLLKQIQKQGGGEPDLWCQDCGLAKLPRKAPKW